MNNFLIQAWNAKVSVHDTVYHLGDFAMSKPENYLLHLNGQIYLIPGNHDRVEVFLNLTKTSNGKIIVLPELQRTKIAGQNLTLCHYAMRIWDKSHHGAWNLFGHSHGTFKPEGKQMDVGVDTTPSYSPYSFNEIVEIMDSKPQAEAIDHHGRDRG